MSKARQTKNNGATLGFEATLWAAADKLRGHMDAAEYKHVVLGLVFLKYISDAFEARRAILADDPEADPEDPDEYALVEVDLVDCIVAPPGQLFYGTGIPACLWFLSRDRSGNRRVVADNFVSGGAKSCLSMPGEWARW